MLFSIATHASKGPSTKALPINAGVNFEGDTMLDPKWGVLIVALAIFALAAGYDATLGWAVGVVIVVLAAIFLWIRVRLGLHPGESPADRGTIARRYSLLGRNRREAQRARQLAEDARASKTEDD